MPRLVRRRPLGERILAYLNPYDFLLWLSEEFEGGEWDELEKNWSLPIGLGLNLVFLIARANSRPGGSQDFDDVFGDGDGTSLLSWLVRYLLFPCTFTEFHLQKTDLRWTDLVHRSFHGPGVRRQCFLYFHEEATLPNV